MIWLRIFYVLFSAMLLMSLTLSMLALSIWSLWNGDLVIGMGSTGLGFLGALAIGLVTKEANKLADETD